MRVLFWIVGASVLLSTAVFMVWLIARNWTPEVYKPVISVLAAGAVTLGITVFSVLKGSTIEPVAFPSTVIIDNRTGLQASVGGMGDGGVDVTDSPQARIVARHSRLSIMLIDKGYKPAEGRRPDEFVAELFVYKLLSDLELRQGPDSSIGYVGPDERGVNRVSERITKRAKPPNAVEVQEPTLREWLRASPIVMLPFEHDPNRIRKMWLPAGARLSLDSCTETTIPCWRIKIVRPRVFEVRIDVEGRGSGGHGFLPPVVHIPSDEITHMSTYHVRVAMQASFHWSSAGSPDMPGYKRWVSYLFSTLEQMNSDDLR